MFSNARTDRELWSFVAGNYSVKTGTIANVRFLNLGGNTHYKFDLKMAFEGGRWGTVLGILSPPYQNMDEGEHTLMFGGSGVTLVCKFIPLSEGEKIILWRGTVAVRVEGDSRTLLRLSRRIF